MTALTKRCLTRSASRLLLRKPCYMTGQGLLTYFGSATRDLENLIVTLESSQGVGSHKQALVLLEEVGC